MARGLILVLLAVAVGGAACAEEEPAFDPAIITDAVQVELDPLGVTEVMCPDLVTAEGGIDPTAEGDDPPSASLPEFGGELACTATLNGDPVDLLVTVAPAFDGALGVAADVLTPLFDVATVETAAAARLDAELGGAPEIDCAERLVVIAPGREIECRVTAAGGTAGPVDRNLTIVILDADANWEIDLVP